MATEYQKDILEDSSENQGPADADLFVGEVQEELSEREIYKATDLASVFFSLPESPCCQYCRDCSDIALHVFKISYSACH